MRQACKQLNTSQETCLSALQLSKGMSGEKRAKTEEQYVLRSISRRGGDGAKGLEVAR